MISVFACVALAYETAQKNPTNHRRHVVLLYTVWFSGDCWFWGFVHLVLLSCGMLGGLGLVFLL